MKKLIMALLLMLIITANAQEMQKDIQDIKISLARMEERFNSIDRRFEMAQKQMDDLRNLMYILISSIFGLFGFVLWDRKSTLSPFGKALKESEQEQFGLKQRIKKLEEALATIINTEPKFRDAMHKIGML